VQFDVGQSDVGRACVSLVRSVSGTAADRAAQF
jgi:hypothetical protein